MDQRGDRSAVTMMTGGTLERTPAAEVFRGVYRERASARLLIAHRGEERTFWFDRGALVGSSSNREAQLVGELMRTFGLADENLLLSAFEKALTDPGRGLSKALSESGAVPGYVAEATVRALAERLLFDTFRWAGGAFTVTPLERPPDVPVRFDRTTGSLILESLRRYPASSPQQGLAPESKARPALASELILRYQALTLAPEEAEVLGRVDGVRTADEVSRDPRILLRLAAVGLVYFPPPGKTPDAGPPADVPLSLNVELGGAPPPPRAAEMMESQANLIWNTYRRLDWASLYDVVGVEESAPLDAIQRAVHERARLFHPDHALKPHLADARDALETLFQKVRMAERVFRSDPSRAGYDQSLIGGDAVVLPGTSPTPEVQKQIAKANYARAKILYDEEDYYPAFEMTKQAVAFDPGQKDYWILLSRIQRKNPKWLRHSTDTIRRALEKIPANVELLFELSEACLAEHNEPERVKALREILKIDPANRRAQSALSEIGEKEKKK
jgi:tetratricopeptide (TPR) repeat protein